MLIFAAILAIFVYGMTAAMLGTILPDLSERFHLTPAQNGTIAFAQALGLMIASLAVGPLLDTQGFDRPASRPRLHRCGAVRAAESRRIRFYRVSAVSAGRWRRHRRDGSECAVFGGEPRASRDRAQSGEPLLWARRTVDAVSLSQFVQEEPVSALLCDRRGHGGHACGSCVHADACADGQCRVCARRCRTDSGEAAAADAGDFCFSILVAKLVCGTGFRGI